MENERYLVKKDQRGCVFTAGPLPEIEDGEDTAVEGGTGVTRGEAQPGVQDPLLLQSGTLEPARMVHSHWSRSVETVL